MLERETYNDDFISGYLTIAYISSSIYKQEVTYLFSM